MTSEPSPPEPTPATPSNRAALIWLFAIPLLSILLFVGLITVLQGKAARLEQERDRGYKVHNILLGMHNYLDVYKSFPPCSFNSPAGKPLYSWRISLAPYAGDGSCGGRLINRNAAWNDPDMIIRFSCYHDHEKDANFFLGPNAHVSPDMQSKVIPGPWTYCFHPLDNDNTRNTSDTSVLAITGPDCIMRDPESARTNPFQWKDIPSGAMENFIYVVEVFNSGVHWMEPTDLVVRANQITLRGQPFEFKVPDSARGFHIAFSDGQSRLLSRKTPLEALLPLMTLTSAATADREKLLGPYTLKK